jgi:hypothetical protein
VQKWSKFLYWFLSGYFGVSAVDLEGFFMGISINNISDYSKISVKNYSPKNPTLKNDTIHFRNPIQHLLSILQINLNNQKFVEMKSKLHVCLHLVGFIFQALDEPINKINGFRTQFNT